MCKPLNPNPLQPPCSNLAPFLWALQALQDAKSDAPRLWETLLDEGNLLVPPLQSGSYPVRQKYLPMTKTVYACSTVLQHWTQLKPTHGREPLWCPEAAPFFPAQKDLLVSKIHMAPL